jgi:hypothetical protein
MTCFNDLPDAVLNYIFEKYFPLSTSFSTLSLVCHKWLRIIGENADIMRKSIIRIKSECNELVISKRKYRRLEFSECDAGQILHKIHGSESLELLEEIGFQDCRFSYDQINLSTLTQLKVILHDKRCRSCIAKDRLKVSNTTVKLGQFVNENNLQLVYIAFDDAEFIFESMPKDFGLLNEFSSLWSTAEKFNFVRTYFSPYLKHLCIYDTFSTVDRLLVEACSQYLVDVKEVKLPTLEIVTYHFDMLKDPVVYTLLSKLDMQVLLNNELLNKILKNFTNLKELVVKLEPNIQKGNKLVEQMAKHLPKLEALTITLLCKQKLDLRIFSKMPNLKKLKIEVHIDWWLRRLSFSKAELYTLNTLDTCPCWAANVQEFETSDIILNDKVLQQIMKLMPNLKKFGLRYCQKITTDGLIGRKKKTSRRIYTINDLEKLEVLTLDLVLCNEDLAKFLQLRCLKRLNLAKDVNDERRRIPNYYKKCLMRNCVCLKDLCLLEVNQ